MFNIFDQHLSPGRWSLEPIVGLNSLLCASMWFPESYNMARDTKCSCVPPVPAEKATVDPFLLHKHTRLKKKKSYVEETELDTGMVCLFFWLGLYVFSGFCRWV